jgi:tetratricopeptide (TPR) repeat protein
MFNDHPTKQDFEGFFRRASEPKKTARTTELIRHLLAECPSCLAQLETMGWSGERMERLVFMPRLPSEDVAPEPGMSVGGSYDYSSAFAKAERQLEQLFAADLVYGTEPAALFAKLALLSPAEQIVQATNEEIFASPGLVPLLVDASHAARYDDPERMLHYANLARLVADASVTGEGHRPAIDDLRANAWGQFGNALRVMGRLREAEEAMAQAQAFLEAGSGDRLLRARLFEQIATLHTFQRQFDSAAALLDSSIAIYEERNERHALARPLVQKAIASIYAGDPESAIRQLNRAIPLIDNEEDPHLLLAACHNLVRCYIDLDQPEQALSLYTEAQDLYKEFDDSLILLRATWQEGQLLRDLGRLGTAETTLLRARKGFMDKGLSYEVAVVSLDLTAVYVQLGSANDVRQAVADALPIFRSLQVDRETLASLLLLQKVADQENEALGLIRLIASRLEQIPHRPAALR